MEMSGAIYRKEISSGQKKLEKWGSLTWLAGREISGTKGVTVGRVVIKKGMSNPRHCHPNCEEVLYLLTGKLEHTIGNDKVIVEAGDSLLIREGVFHNATSTGECDADMIVAYSSSTREMIEE